MKHKQAMLLVVIVVLIFIAIRLAPEVVEFKPLELQAITGLLGLLIFIALLLERFLDVFLTVSRAQESENKFRTIMTLQAQIRDHRAKKEQVPGKLSDDLRDAQDALAGHRRGRGSLQCGTVSPVAFWLAASVSEPSAHSRCSAHLMGCRQRNTICSTLWIYC